MTLLEDVVGYIEDLLGITLGKGRYNSNNLSIHFMTGAKSPNIVVVDISSRNIPAVSITIRRGTNWREILKAILAPSPRYPKMTNLDVAKELLLIERSSKEVNQALNLLARPDEVNTEYTWHDFK